MIFNLLKIRNFRNFFFSEIISGFGIGMSTVGANWFLLDQTHSSKLIGFAFSLNVIAGFLISPLIGTLTDKFNRKAIILWTYLIQAFVLMSITGLLFSTGFSVWYVYLFTIVNGMGWTTYMATSRSLVQELLPEKDFIHGNSLTEISLQVGMFMAGAASGILYKFFGFNVILIVNASTFILSSLVLSRIQYTSTIEDDKKESFVRSFKSGINYLTDRPKIFLLGVVSIVPMVTTMIYNVVLPGYVEDTVKGSSIVFGLSDMCYGIGGFLSALVVSSMVKKVSNQVSVSVFFLIAISTLFALVFNQYALMLFLGSLLFGLCNSALRILMNTTLMEVVSKSFMGRALSVWMATSLLLQIFTSSGLGIVIDRFSANIGFVCLGVLMLAGFVLHRIIVGTVAVKTTEVDM